MRVPGLAARAERADRRDDAQVLLELAGFDLLAPAWPACGCGPGLKRAARQACFLLALQVRSQKAQVGAGAEEQGSEHRRPYYDVDDGQAPAAGFARDARARGRRSR